MFADRQHGFEGRFGFLEYATLIGKHLRANGRSMMRRQIDEDAHDDSVSGVGSRW